MTDYMPGSRYFACAIIPRIAANPARRVCLSLIHFRERIMLSLFRRLARNTEGATAIEYTLIASLIAVAAIVAMGSVGTKVNTVLSNVASTMK
jgi:pilus assembly protein Flp/PilA